MSKETKTMKQHFVPKKHLKRFENKEGKIFVHTFDENKNIKSYPSSAAKVCRLVNYYDEDPYSMESVERALKCMEDEGQAEIDKVVIEEIFNASREVLVKYATMLMNRTILMRNIVDEMANAGNTFGVDGRICQGMVIKKSNEMMMFNDPEDMVCMSLTSHNGDFLTSDVPITGYPLRSSAELPFISKLITDNIKSPEIHTKKELTDFALNALKEQNRYMIFVCPLSSSHCLFVYRKDYVEFLRDFATKIGPNPVMFVNKLMILGCLGTVYSGYDRKEEIQSILHSLPPFSDLDLKYMRMYKESQKNNR